MNKLSEANSPYLLQHADNPVDWFPWGEAALQKAKSEDKPIFLSIGYAACHWCHVMAHESFEDPDTAAIMNEHFVNIKVDREERPDIDNIYMTAVVAMIGQGGWPMSVFLTPDGQPFYGGTYFPPFPRYNMPSFRDVLLSVARAWKDDRQKIIDSSYKITEYLQQAQTTGGHITRLAPDVLQRASLSLAQSYDWGHGGWGRAPKFPQPMAIEYLLQRASLGDKFSLEISLHALDAMAKGGMYDVIGGGFSRYSTDDDWLVPHFEKMLYDNAQLSQVYLHAYLLTGNVRYREICEKTLDFVLRELSDPRGGFYSSLDADSEGEEGKFYVWTLDEINASLKHEADVELLVEAYGVTEGGNFEGKNVLQRKVDDQALADRFNMSTETLKERLEQFQDHLLLARSSRVRPGTDDKVITAWNALMMTSFAEAGRYLGHEGYLEVARRNASFLLDNMFRNGILLRSWRNGNSEHFAYLDDYAALALGLIALYQSDPDVRWFKSAYSLLAEILDHFRHPDWGFYDTRDDHQQLIVRPRDLQDNAVPSGNALTAQALLMISAYTADVDLRSEAEKMLAAMQEETMRHPLGFARWLSAFDFLFSDVKEVAILGDLDSPDTNALRNALWAKFRPHLVSAISKSSPPEGAPFLLMDRPLRGGVATAYVCQNFVCQQPVNLPEQLIAQLDVIEGPAGQG